VVRAALAKSMGNQTDGVLVMDNDPSQIPATTWPDTDACGNAWYPFSVARHWSIGVPVVVRRTSRETRLFTYSIYSHWKPGLPGSEDDRFLMLDRMPEKQDKPQ